MKRQYSRGVHNNLYLLVTHQAQMGISKARAVQKSLKVGVQLRKMAIRQHLLFRILDETGLSRKSSCLPAQNQ